MSDANVQAPTPVDPDIVVAYADEIEHYRFVTRRCAYANFSRQPASFVYASGGLCELAGRDELWFRQTTLSNRSIWIRDHDCDAKECNFVNAVRGTDFNGAILLEEIYQSRLQEYAQRLNAAFIALGVRMWNIVAEESTDKSLESEVNAKGSGSVEVKGKGGQLEYEKTQKKIRTFKETLTSNIKVEYKKDRRKDVDPDTVKDEIRRLRLSRDPIIQTLVASRVNKIPYKGGDLELGFKFKGEMEDSFNIVFKIAAKVHNVSANMECEYNAFCKAAKTLESNFKVHVED